MHILSLDCRVCFSSIVWTGTPHPSLCSNPWGGEWRCGSTSCIGYKHSLIAASRSYSITRGRPSHTQLPHVLSVFGFLCASSCRAEMRHIKPIWWGMAPFHPVEVTCRGRGPSPKGAFRVKMHHRINEGSFLWPLLIDAACTWGTEETFMLTGWNSDTTRREEGEIYHVGP